MNGLSDIRRANDRAMEHALTQRREAYRRRLDDNDWFLKLSDLPESIAVAHVLALCRNDFASPEAYQAQLVAFRKMYTMRGLSKKGDGFDWLRFRRVANGEVEV